MEMIMRKLKLYLMRIFKRIWRLWAKALGEKVGNEKEADQIATLRTLIIIQAVVTNVLISINIIINWLK